MRSWKLGDSSMRVITSSGSTTVSNGCRESEKQHPCKITLFFYIDFAIDRLPLGVTMVLVEKWRLIYNKYNRTMRPAFEAHFKDEMQLFNDCLQALHVLIMTAYDRVYTHLRTEMWEILSKTPNWSLFYLFIDFFFRRYEKEIRHHFERLRQQIEVNSMWEQSTFKIFAWKWMILYRCENTGTN